MGTAVLTSTIDCCSLLLICLPKAFHDGSFKFTTGYFECMVCLKKFTLQKSRYYPLKLTALTMPRLELGTPVGKFTLCIVCYCRKQWSTTERKERHNPRRGIHDISSFTMNSMSNVITSPRIYITVPQILASASLTFTQITLCYLLYFKTGNLLLSQGINPMGKSPGDVSEEPVT